MTNSLTLKQCHFPKQSRIFQSTSADFLKAYPTGQLRFFSLIRGGYSYGEGTAGLRPGERTAAPPLASKATTRSAPPFEQYFKCKVKNVS